MYLNEASLNRLLEDQVANLLAHPITAYPSPHIFVPDADPHYWSSYGGAVPGRKLFSRSMEGGELLDECRP